MAQLVAITGGIGSGKSVVSNILRILGYPVYDCDTEAKNLIKSNDNLKQALKAEFGESIYQNNGELDNKKLASIVFNNKAKLSVLNSLVHPIVKSDIIEWSLKFNDNDLIFFESAILKEANLEDIINAVVIVDAPHRIKVARVIKRNNISSEEVEQRIKNQEKFYSFSVKTYRVNNDNINPIIPQVNDILSQLRH